MLGAPLRRASATDEPPLAVSGQPDLLARSMSALDCYIDRGGGRGGGRGQGEGQFGKHASITRNVVSTLLLKPVERLCAECGGGLLGSGSVGLLLQQRQHIVQCTNAMRMHRAPIFTDDV